MDKEETIELQKKIIAQSTGLTEGNIALVIPKAGDPTSHGYQLHIKFENAKSEINKIKTIAQANNLAVEIRKDTVIIFRPCFEGYSNKNLDLI